MSQPLPCRDEIHNMLPSLHPKAADFKSAYDIVLAAYEAANADVDRMHVRIVGHLMVTLWQLADTLPSAFAVLIREVLSMKTDATGASDVKQLGVHYQNFLLRAFRKQKGRTPASSRHPSRPSFDTMKDLTAFLLQGAGDDYKAIKNQALVRDGFRCIITGSVERSAEKCVGGLEDEYEETQCCHILSQSTVQNTNNPDKLEYATGVLTVLKAFGVVSMYDQFVQQNGVHCLENVLTLADYCHTRFDNLKLALEPCGPLRPNEYTIRFYQYEGPRWRHLQNKDRIG